MQTLVSIVQSKPGPCGSCRGFIYTSTYCGMCKYLPGYLVNARRARCLAMRVGMEEIKKALSEAATSTESKPN